MHSSKLLIGAGLVIGSLSDLESRILPTLYLQVLISEVGKVFH